MAEPGQLSVNDRVLLHLSRFATDIPPKEFPPETAQAGIASAVGISRTHVPRAVKSLVKEGTVSELTARVRGHERRMNVYTLSPEGLQKADQLWKEALASVFQVLADGRTATMKGSDIETAVGKKRAIAAISQMRDGVVEIDKRRRAPVKDLKGAPSQEGFCGRDPELREMDDFMESHARILVVLGNRGYGTTTLVRRFVEEQEDLDILWIKLDKDITAEQLQKRLRDFGATVNKDAGTLEDVLDLRTVLVVFDDYYAVSEEIVEFFGFIIDLVGEAKVIVTARQETPAYNWFYHKKEVDSGVVRELKIKGLDEESARELLGNDKIEKDALRRIMMITRGQPMALKMLRDGDERGLRENSVFTPEEIKYLLFLRTKNS